MLSRRALQACPRKELANAIFLSRGLATEAPLTQSSPAEPRTKTQRPKLNAAIVLNRAPILTSTQTPFERAYFAYQARIRRALHNPFPYEFYFKQGSLVETRFNMEEKRRERRAFGPTFAPEEDTEGADDAAAAAVEQLSKQEGEGEVFMPRVHESDKTRDLKSLDRNGRRNVYLLLKAKDSGKEIWRFPQGDVTKGELLHQAAQRDLIAECGPNMDAWIVSRNPIGMYRASTVSEDPVSQPTTFFLKAHIMAGQAQLASPNILDFAWLTKEEIEPYVEPHYWAGVKDMLSDN